MSVSTHQLRILVVAVLVVVIGYTVAVLKGQQASASDVSQGAPVNDSFALRAPLDGGLNSGLNSNTSSPPSMIGLRTH